MSGDEPHLLDRFTPRAEDYALHRPNYPPEAIDAVLEGLGEPGRLHIADLGAGTGIAARLLAKRGARVTAVEPNARMREAAQPHPGVSWVAGQAENTGLPEASVELVTAFQAFHWFDPGPALAEMRRILRPSGRVALVWNLRVDTDPFTAAYHEVAARYAVRPPGDRGSVEALAASPLFTGLTTVIVPNAQSLDVPGLWGRARSTSYLPLEGEQARGLQRELAALHARFAGRDGLVTLRYQTEVHRVIGRSPVPP